MKCGITITCLLGCRCLTIFTIQDEGTIWISTFFCNCLWISRIRKNFPMIPIMIKILFVWPALINDTSDRDLGIWLYSFTLLGKGWNIHSSWWVMICCSCLLLFTHKGNHPNTLDILSHWYSFSRWSYLSIKRNMV